MVVSTQVCPSSSCTVRMALPFSSKWVAKGVYI